MPEFILEVADHTARVCALFDSTRFYCHNYLSCRDPELTVTVSEEDLAFEQQSFREEALLLGLRPRVFTQPFLERAAVQRKLAQHLLEHDTVLFHGSAVAVDGCAYLFTAACGTGKSTHTRLWRELLGERAVMINDDKPFLRIVPEGITVYGSPWSGKHGLDANIAAPLKGICILTQGSEDRIRPATPQEALAMLQLQCCPPCPRQLPRCLDLAAQLARQVPVWHMACTPTLSAAQLAYKTMTGQFT